jgi:hypothetical protein
LQQLEEKKKSVVASIVINNVSDKGSTYELRKMNAAGKALIPKEKQTITGNDFRSYVVSQLAKVKPSALRTASVFG